MRQQKKKKQDETEYLASSENNRKMLDKSIQQIQQGHGIKVNIDDLWKDLDGHK
jgi:PHD/YefM family antitoxin component YafN of YafNO toxin-antitoxin module